MSIRLSPRLMTALPYVRPGHLLADVGTDHAYLPIYLCEQGILTPVSAADGSTLCAIASDINRGPVERADLHIRSAGYGNMIHTVCTDGLRGLDRWDPDDVTIFGMGGDLMAAILAAAPWIHAPGKRLILQPMTHAEVVRAYLVENGFSIVGETYSSETVSGNTRLYQTICADFGAGDTPTHTALYEQYIGHIPAAPDQRALYRELAVKTRNTIQTRQKAKREAGQPTDLEDTLLEQLDGCLDSF